MLAWVTLSVPTFTFSLASTACRHAQHQITTNRCFYFQFCFCHTCFDFKCSCLRQASIQLKSATPMASVVSFRWGLKTNISNMYACMYTPDTGQPGSTLGFSSNWRPKVWSFLLYIPDELPCSKQYCFFCKAAVYTAYDIHWLNEGVQSVSHSVVRSHSNDESTAP